MTNSPKKIEDWESVKAGLYELDEMEFAGSRDKLFSYIDRLLQAREEEIKSWVKKNSYEPIDSYSSPEDGMGIVDTGRLLKFLTTKPK